MSPTYSRIPVSRNRSNVRNDTRKCRQVHQSRTSTSSSLPRAKFSASTSESLDCSPFVRDRYKRVMSPNVGMVGPRLSSAPAAARIVFGTKELSGNQILSLNDAGNTDTGTIQVAEDLSAFRHRQNHQSATGPHLYPIDIDSWETAAQLYGTTRSTTRSLGPESIRTTTSCADNEVPARRLIVTVLDRQSDARPSRETVPQVPVRSSSSGITTSSFDHLPSYYEAVSPPYVPSNSEVVQYGIGFLCFLLGLALTLLQSAFLAPFALKIGALALVLFNLFYTLFAVPFLFRQQSTLALPCCFFTFGICSVSALAWAREAAYLGKL